MAKAKDGRVKNTAIIVIIALFLVSSITGTFLLAIQSSGSSKTAAQIEQERALAEYQDEQKTAQEDTVNEPLEGYEAKAFDAQSVTELKVDVLKQGEGKVAAAESTVKANYFGWTSDGRIFDSTNKNGTTTPIDFPLSGVISGWTKGLTGIKQGSVVKLSIPGDMAYGNQDDGSGRPSGPLVFVVELVEVK